MRKLLLWGAIALVGLVLGLASAALVLWIGFEKGSITSGRWKTNLSSGSQEAGMYTRARVALFGLLALKKEESIYFVATADSQGGALSGDCVYRLEGADMPARWWTLTAYGPDSYLIANTARIYSVSKSRVQRDADGRFTIRVSAQQEQGNWLPVQAGRRFDLTARLYNPDPSVYAAPGAVVLPAIVKERCR